MPSEHSCGQSRRLGTITKAGSTHARRLLVEAALHYRLTPAVGGKLAGRQRGHDPALLHLWKRGSEPVSAAFHACGQRESGRLLFVQGAVSSIPSRSLESAAFIEEQASRPALLLVVPSDRPTPSSAMLACTRKAGA